MYIEIQKFTLNLSEEKSMKDVSFIIVNYNGGAILFNCIESIVNSIKNLNYEIVVVDNASKDGSIENIEKELNWSSVIKVVKNKENLGFAKANNIGVNEASSNLLFFLNPDTLVDNKIEKALVEIIEANNQKYVYVPKLKEKDGEVINTGYLIPTIKNYINHYLFKKDADFWYLGAAVIMHKDIFKDINGWSEDYFMYAEDLDLFFTLLRKGYKTKVIPVEISHIGGGITDNVWSQYERLLRVEKSNFKFFKKYNLKFDYVVLSSLRIIKNFFKNPKKASLMYKVFIKTFLQKN